ncbi:MAG: ATP12 family protein [Sphingomonas sp.]|jgi:chaperone required for assembly of F1-ATPase
MKRFWKETRIAEQPQGHAIELDGRPVRTPGRALLAVPTLALALAIAGEWDAVADTIDPRAMPLTGLANAAIDPIAADPASFAADLARYGESDLLCYRAEGPAPLVARQHQIWDPALDWAQTRYDIRFALVTGIMHRPQPAATLARLRDVMAAYGPFVLAGLSPVITITGSLVLALALAEGAMGADKAWDAAHLDETWQAEQWGEDELAIGARDARRRDFDAGVRFLALLG